MVRVKTFSTTDVVQSTSKVFNFDKKDIALISHDGEFYAIDDLC